MKTRSGKCLHFNGEANLHTSLKSQCTNKSTIDFTKRFEIGVCFEQIKTKQFQVAKTIKGETGVSLFFFFLFMAAPVPCGSFQAWGHMGAAAASLHHSHSNNEFELSL